MLLPFLVKIVTSCGLRSITHLLWPRKNKLGAAPQGSNAAQYVVFCGASQTLMCMQIKRWGFLQQVRMGPESLHFNKLPEVVVMLACESFVEK